MERRRRWWKRRERNLLTRLRGRTPAPFSQDPRQLSLPDILPTPDQNTRSAHRGDPAQSAMRVKRRHCGARPMQLDWVRNIRDQCIAADVAFFFKRDAVHGRKVPLPELDGRQWRQFPQTGRCR